MRFRKGWLMLPFSREQYLFVFIAYNEAIWPAQIVTFLLGLVAFAAALKPGQTTTRLAAGILAAFWVWTGVAYHWLFFAAINKAAYLFGAMFVVQDIAVVYAGLTGMGRLRFGFQRGPASWIGILFVLYSAVLYPLIGIWTGHPYPTMPMFGVTPCPVTIFTFGLFLLTVERLPRWLLIIPFLWSLVGGSAAILIDVPQDWFLLASGVIAVPLVLVRDRKPRRSPRS